LTWEIFWDTKSWLASYQHFIKPCICILSKRAKFFFFKYSSLEHQFQWSFWGFLFWKYLHIS
jgi:hypothetical protein